MVRLRAAIDRDRDGREIEVVYGAEGTARLGLSLERLLAGLDTLGVDRDTALRMVETVAMDSTPPIRRSAYEYLIRVATQVETAQVAAADENCPQALGRLGGIRSRETHPTGERQPGLVGGHRVMGRTRYGPKAGPSPHFAPLCLIGPSHTHVYANCGDGQRPVSQAYVSETGSYASREKRNDISQS